MKHEFMPFDNSQGNEQPYLEQKPMPQIPLNAQPNIPNGQPSLLQDGSLPRMPRPKGSGLLSNWKSSQNQPGQVGQQGYVLNSTPNIAKPSTPAQPQGPITGPTYPTYQQQNGQPFNPQQNPNRQNVPPFNSTPSWQEPNAQNTLPYNPQQQAINGQIAQPFNPASQPFAPAKQRQPYQNPGAQPMLGSPNPSFGPQSAQGQPQNSWQQGQMRQMAPMGPTNNGIPPNMPAQGSNGQGGGKKQPRKKKRRFPIWARVVVSILAVLLILIGSGVYYYEANFASVIANSTGQTTTRNKNDVNPNQNQNPSGSILSGNRINILLLGSDDDYKTVAINHGVLAQTDIIVSIDPPTHSVTMFSLPRDTWLNVPGYGMLKLDQAFLKGGGGANGASLVMATIHQDFGVYIDHYAWVGLSGFTKVIDAVGGIDINAIHPITDDTYPDDTGKGATDPYAVKRLFIAAGPQHLNGLAALEYVRSRHADLVGDIGRSVRQQQILNQLKYKLNNPGIIGQLPTLASDLNGSVKTDMSFQQVFDLMNFARSVDQSKIQKITLGAPYSSGATIDNQDVIQLNCALVQPLIAQTFKIGNNALCNLQANSSGSSAVASVTPSSPTANVRVQTSSNGPWQVVSNMTQTSSMVFSGNWNDLMGLHGLLDLMFLATFESYDALLV